MRPCQPHESLRCISAVPPWNETLEHGARVSIAETVCREAEYVRQILLGQLSFLPQRLDPLADNSCRHPNLRVPVFLALRQLRHIYAIFCRHSTPPTVRSYRIPLSAFAIHQFSASKPTCMPHSERPDAAHRVPAIALTPAPRSLRHVQPFHMPRIPKEPPEEPAMAEPFTMDAGPSDAFAPSPDPIEGMVHRIQIRFRASDGQMWTAGTDTMALDGQCRGFLRRAQSNAPARS